MLFQGSQRGCLRNRCNLIDVEVDYRPGAGRGEHKTIFHTVGLPDARRCARAATRRACAAIKNSGYSIPPTHITINLAPADIKKEGSASICPSPSASSAQYGAPAHQPT